jgi:hypothetical protein
MHGIREISISNIAWELYPWKIAKKLILFLSKYKVSYLEQAIGSRRE